MRKAKKEEPEEYEVEKIVNHRIAGRAKKRIEYFIKWKGYSSKDNTWEPSSAVYIVDYFYFFISNLFL
ncbi:uncharacterized protein RHIMIDRAFT_42331 [Rhizopus microsporus ATCC 52813]|uniref:Chromo domain-containing protein n=1 Tax=Rhizopus microsporus ATCC 52813 TaxID=1340429 RepID=A0A2G4SMV1_RHIZD|nr:uncharacterized protein RHIMIDRAFT_42331 [Rhizopus microsporus ATCC 52813]PHZ10072.1 hypothetical protein RHIMIDRAFT_42331 [Rhizopus microsporus ATCC 52813]